MYSTVPVSAIVIIMCGLHMTTFLFSGSIYTREFISEGYWKMKQLPLGLIDFYFTYLKLEGLVWLYLGPLLFIVYNS